MERRRLFWHGIFLFFLGLLSGVLVQTMTNPRMGLAAHTSGVASGTFLAVLGAVWSELRLGTRAEGAAYWLAVYGAYAGWAAVQLAAIFGTSRMTPIAGAGAQRTGLSGSDRQLRARDGCGGPLGGLHPPALGPPRTSVAGGMHAPDTFPSGFDAGAIFA